VIDCADVFKGFGQSGNIGDVSLKMLNDWFSTAGGSLNLDLSLV